MYSDPTCKAETAPAKPIADLGLADLIAWLETQDPAKPYRYADFGGCAIAQFYHAHGYPQAEVDSDFVYPTGAGLVERFTPGATAADIFTPPNDWRHLPAHFNDIAQPAFSGSWGSGTTFGQALVRAKACL